jgi:putative nucleotidyltransferase with HDIG domain
MRIWHVMRVGLVGLLPVAATALVVGYELLPFAQGPTLQAGQVAPETIHAPRRITYISDIQTQAAREAAFASVSDIYDPPDPRVARQQVLAARQIMNFIKTVRHDTIASPQLRADYLGQIKAVKLAPENRDLLLAASDAQFAAIESQVVAVLAEVMSGEVREGNVERAKSGLILAVSVELPVDHAPAVVDTVDDLIVPNTYLDSAATEEARLTARWAVEPIKQTFEAGEVVVRAGEIVTEADIEALVKLGLVQERATWQEWFGVLVASLLTTSLLVASLARFQADPLTDLSTPALVVGLYVIFLVVARLMIPDHTVIPYLYPAAALSMLMVTLVGTDLAVAGTLILAALVGLIAGGSLDLAFHAAMGGLTAAITLRRAAGLNGFFLAGLLAGVVQSGVVLVFKMPDPMTDSLGLAQLLGASLINGLLSAAFALVVLYAIGNLFGLTTSLTLLELQRPNHPLLQRLQREAPGTYQHTLQVANLAESAAEAIGADGQLVRVGTLYHDIGKMVRPYFFIENRLEGGQNPHDKLDPYTSAEIIIDHVQDGLDLARQYRLPARVYAFIPEHHGTTTLQTFYHKAREQAVEPDLIDRVAFVYPGPRPQSRETAILMMADGTESAVRANRPESAKELEEIIERIVQQRMEWGQLDDSGLTLTDLQAIKRSFLASLKGVFHPRIRYPDDKPGPEPKPSEDQPREQPLPGTSLPDGSRVQVDEEARSAAQPDWERRGRER